jgi:hypothetical protein
LDRTALALHDVVVSKVRDGHLLLVMTSMPGDPLSLLFRGTDWSVQYAVARGARLASIKGGDLWYTADSMLTFEYLETFRAAPGTRLS